LTYGEIDAEARAYGEYIARFDPKTDVPRLSYLVVPADLPEQFIHNLDQWYERYAAESFGEYVLYRLRLR
jgi:hypothetical protein